MAIKFRKNAIKFLEKANLEDAEKIQEKISQLLLFVEEQAIIPFTEFDIKKMKGDWEGFYRLRIGKIRIVFTVNTQSGEVEIFTIGARGDVYK
ncbi:type II toxin-antitoxin system RelE/ParE family toxin [Aphanizomenon flos-aquae NRERC-008]|jgi:mRNA interferase RelE/StbE|uniref:Type II toxin-antitoxin system RelE/ParE family toxin n=1 Tax=Aphanizomenon flos-aquae FACHB-1249 TaxID=2692889 RepID=A0ABR8IPV3_APHFL|nr:MULTISPECIES: type II toxin-antitoxin system RelE/ParE family toxin [Aphanizomenonaceae]MBJ7297133.1 type II toxin-antitoxin system RelE/ParE family toxin [Dolichospermum sp.]MBD2390184.1 type II toxin-antitoxin system RelE/ParE family toxin [Aphanizomenon flos-aquae FACHB-1171]MBD2557951.1 type II toxin-antitoxin system RelE/ParE family toxin [Aphanizomenon flos-aquae FACHB-1290]MBD2631102.1 type II toxin-antitoxin system RelE/ParE family toxin [Aphanizomenon sp. FACHB-1399]MBD2642082.1 ty